MALQLVDKAGGGEVTLVSMAPNSEMGGLRTALAMGAAKAILDHRRRPRGRRRPRHRQGARRRHQAGRAPTWCSPPPSRPTATPAPSPSRSPRCSACPSITFAKYDRDRRRHGKVQRQTEAGYDEVECPLPAVVSVTAGVVEPRYPSFKGIMAAKSKPVDELTVADLGLDAGQVGWAGAGQEIVAVEAAPEPRGRRDHRGRRRGLQQDRRVPRRPQGHLSPDPRRNEHTWLSTRSGSTPRPPTARSARITLELLTKARELGDTVEAVYAGADADAVAGALGAHGATKVHATGDLGGSLPGVPVASAIAAAIEGGNGPDLHPVRHHLRRPRHRRPACR